MQNIHKGHRAREKKQALESNLSSYPEHKLLELLLYYSIPRRDTNGTAHDLLERFRSIKGIFCADRAELLNVPDIGENTALLFEIIEELMRRYRLSEIKGKSFDSVAKLGDYFVAKFVGVGHEQFYVMLLDGALRMIDCKIIFQGSASSAGADYRRIFEYISDHRATNVVIAHNHPSGIAIPSESDLDLTYRMAMQLENLGIYLREHFVVAGERYTPIMRNSEDRLLKNLSTLKD